MDQFKVTQEGVLSPLPTSKDSEEQYLSLSEIYACPQPPQMPKKLPQLVKVVTSLTPDDFKATVAQNMFPPLAIYPKHLSFTYLDNQERQLRINCLTVGDTGGGKDVSTRQPLKYILADVKQRDEENRIRLLAFNSEYNRKGANAEKPPRPDDLVIQCIKSDITRAALYQRMDEAQSAPLYVKLNEIEQWDKVEGATGKNNQFTTLKLADDEENDFGADRAGTQSVTASGSLFLNWNANTTTSKAIRYFKYVQTDGPISRLCLATVPVRECGSEMPVFGTYDEKYAKKLQPYIDHLKAATGIIKCKQALELAKKLKKECDDFSVLTQDKVFDNLTHRALVHSFRKACLIYAANGMKWEKSIEGFCRWSLHYDLWLKMKVWGDAIRKEDSNIETSKRGPRSLLDELPLDKNGVFSLQDLVNLRQQKNIGKDGTKGLLSKWKQRGLIRQLTEDSYQKVLQI